MKTIVYLIAQNPNIVLLVIAILLLWGGISFLLFILFRNQYRICSFRLQLIQTILVKRLYPSPFPNSTIVSVADTKILDTIHDLRQAFLNKTEHLSKTDSPDYEVLKNVVISMTTEMLLEKIKKERFTSSGLCKALYELRGYHSFDSIYIGRELSDVVLEKILSQEGFDLNFLETLKQARERESLAEIIVFMDREKEILRKLDNNILHAQQKVVRSSLNEICESFKKDLTRVAEVLDEWIERDGKPESSHQ